MYYYIWLTVFLKERRKVVLKINGTKINQSRTCYSSRQRYLDMSQQKYKQFVIRLGTTDKFADIQIPPSDERDADSSDYQKYNKIKNDMSRLTPKEFQKKYIWGGTRNPTHVKTEKARTAVISRRLRTNYDNFAYMNDVLDISTISISGDPKLKELSLFCTADLKQVLNTPLNQLPQLDGTTDYTLVSLISQILADIQSRKTANQNLEMDLDDSSDDAFSCPPSPEEGKDNCDAFMEVDEADSSRSDSQQEKHVAFYSEAWRAKLDKLKKKKALV